MSEFDINEYGSFGEDMFISLTAHFDFAIDMNIEVGALKLSLCHSRETYASMNAFFEMLGWVYGNTSKNKEKLSEYLKIAKGESNRLEYPYPDQKIAYTLSRCIENGTSCTFNQLTPDSSSENFGRINMKTNAKHFYDARICSFELMHEKVGFILTFLSNNEGYSFYDMLEIMKLLTELEKRYDTKLIVCKDLCEKEKYGIPNGVHYFLEIPFDTDSKLDRKLNGKPDDDYNRYALNELSIDIVDEIKGYKYFDTDQIEDRPHST